MRKLSRAFANGTHSDEHALRIAVFRCFCQPSQRWCWSGFCSEMRMPGRVISMSAIKRHTSFSPFDNPQNADPAAPFIV